MAPNCFTEKTINKTILDRPAELYMVVSIVHLVTLDYIAMIALDYIEHIHMYDSWSGDNWIGLHHITFIT